MSTVAMVVGTAPEGRSSPHSKPYTPFASVALNEAVVEPLAVFQVLIAVDPTETLGTLGAV